MPGHVVRLFPEAELEVRQHESWYARRSETAAQAFLAELSHALQLVGDSPTTWPRYRRGTRRFVLRRFPFSVVYRLEDDVVYVIAVAHAKQRPEYWRFRKRP